MGAQERARAGVPCRRREHRRPVLPADQHRVTRLAVVGGDRDGSPGAIGGDQPPHRLGPDERLVGERDHRRVQVVGVSGTVTHGGWATLAGFPEGAQPGGQR
jgi:hypothetical protein